MALLLTETNVLLAIFALSVLVLLFLSARRPYLLGNSLLLLFCLLSGVLFVSSLFGGGYLDIAVRGAVAMLAILALVPMMLIWNGIVMIKRESGRLSNILSLLTGLLIAGGEAATAVFVLRGFQSGTGGFPMPLLPLFGATVFYGAALLLAFVLYMLFLPLVPHRKRFVTVIVHGCALIHGDKVSRILANRLDKAIEVYRKSRGTAHLIVSGGQGKDETVSEAEAMEGYLREKGIPPVAIFREAKSCSSRENLLFADALKKELGLEGKTAIVTSNYHLYRCLLTAHELGIVCTGFGAKVAAYYWPSAVIREFAAVYFRKKFFLWALAGYLLFVIVPFIVLLLG